MAIAIAAMALSGCMSAQPADGPQTAVQPVEQPAEDTPATTDSTDPEPEIIERGDIVLVWGGESLEQTYLNGVAIDPETEICLDPSETAMFASDRSTFELSGEGCFVLGEAEAEAYAADLLMAEAESPAAGVSASLGGNFVVSSSGPSSAQYHVGQKVSDTARICLREGDIVTVLGNGGTRVLRGPGCFMLASMTRTRRFAAMISGNPSRARTGAVRGGSVNGGSRTVTFRVSSATDSVLERFPRGSLVSRSTRICLEEGEQITIVGSNGQRVTYRGPGCARRNARPTEDNLGGFTFGWNTYGIAPDAAVLP